MRECTDPKRWKTVPGLDASEKEVEAYLSHTRECQFHAEIERHNQQMVEAITAIARGKSIDGRLHLPKEEIARIRENLNRSGETGRKNPIGATILGWMPRPALMLMIGIVIVLLVTTRFLITKQPKQIAQQEPQQQQPEKQVPAEKSREPQSTPGQQSPDGKLVDLLSQKSPQSAHPRASDYPHPRERKLKKAIAAKNSSEELPARDTQRVYVSSGFDPELRQALNHSLQVRGVVPVDSEEQADTVLRAEQTRSEDIIVELLSRSHQRLWWMSAKTSSDSPTKVEELAEKIANETLKRIENLSGKKPNAKTQK